MIDIPRSLEFSIIMDARSKGEEFTGPLKPTFRFDGQIGWVEQQVWLHKFGPGVDGRYRAKNVRIEDGALMFTVEKIDNN